VYTEIIYANKMSIMDPLCVNYTDECWLVKNYQHSLTESAYSSLRARTPKFTYGIKKTIKYTNSNVGKLTY
jgi:hypothetical protein